MTDTSTSEQAPPPPGRSALDDVFDRLHGLGLRRDTDRRWFGGVCSGIAARFDVDPLLIRAAAIALAFAGGVGVALYLVLWLLVPDAYERVLAERALRRGETWPVVLGVVTALFLLGGLGSVVFGNTDWGGSLWLVVPVVLVLWFLATRTDHRSAGAGATPPTGSPPPPPGAASMPSPASFAAGAAPAAPTAPQGVAAGVPTRTMPPTAGAPWGTGQPPTAGYPSPPPGPPRPPAPPRPPRPRRRRPSGFVGLVSLGLVILLGGLGIAVADPAGFPGSPAVLGLVLALAGVSAVVLGLGLSGRASGFSGVLVSFLVVATVVAALASHAPTTQGGVGDRTWTPSATGLPGSYGLGAGDAVLDLTDLTRASVPDQDATVHAELGVGQLDVVVPAGLTVRVEASTGIGEIRWDRVRTSGRCSSAVLDTATGPPQLDPSCTTTQDVRSGSDRGATYTTGTGRTPDLVVRAEVGIGDITVIEER